MAAPMLHLALMYRCVKNGYSFEWDILCQSLK